MGFFYGAEKKLEQRIEARLSAEPDVDPEAEKGRHDGDRAVRIVGAGLFVVLVGGPLSVWAAIDSDLGDPGSVDYSEGVDPMSQEAQDAGYIPEPVHWVALNLPTLKREELWRAAEYAQERVALDGSPKTVAHCLDVEARLQRESVGSPDLDCTP